MTSVRIFVTWSVFFAGLGLVIFRHVKGWSTWLDLGALALGGAAMALAPTLAGQGSIPGGIVRTIGVSIGLTVHYRAFGKKSDDREQAVGVDSEQAVDAAKSTEPVRILGLPLIPILAGSAVVLGWLGALFGAAGSSVVSSSLLGFGVAFLVIAGVLTIRGRRSSSGHQ